MSSSSQPAKPRKTPCASCPYRCQVPSGVWDASEYEKLPAYDGETWEQSARVFMCHQGDGAVCSGWLGHRDPSDLLAVRIGIATGNLDPECAEYRTSVRLFESGAEAAVHGVKHIEDPDGRARDTIEKIVRSRRIG